MWNVRCEGGEGNYDGSSVHSPAPAPARPQFSSSLMDLRIIYKHTQTHKFNIIQTKEKCDRGQLTAGGLVTVWMQRRHCTAIVWMASSNIWESNFLYYAHIMYQSSKYEYNCQPATL